MKKKRTAVVGTGWFGQAHIRNFNILSKRVGICDKDENKLNHMAEQYENVNTYTDISYMIRNEDIDAVSIVTPPKFIPEIAKKFA